MSEEYKSDFVELINTLPLAERLKRQNSIAKIAEILGINEPLFLDRRSAKYLKNSSEPDIVVKRLNHVIEVRTPSGDPIDPGQYHTRLAVTLDQAANLFQVKKTSLRTYNSVWRGTYSKVFHGRHGYGERTKVFLGRASQEEKAYLKKLSPEKLKEEVEFFEQVYNLLIQVRDGESDFFEPFEALKLARWER